MRLWLAQQSKAFCVWKRLGLKGQATAAIEQLNQEK